MTTVLRKELVSKLKLAKPGLARRDLVPQLTHFWFTGDSVVTYNDQIGISVPCSTGINGAVPSTLLDILDKSKRKTLELSVSGGNLLVQAGPRSKIKLPIIDPDDFLFEMPTMPDEAKAFSEEQIDSFVNHVRGCMRSIDPQAIFDPDKMGMTVMPMEEGGVVLYTTNGATISTAYVFAPILCERERVLLPEPFCKQALAFCHNAKVVRFHIFESYAMLQADDILLFSRLLDSDKPVNFDEVIKRHLPPDSYTQMGKIPEGLNLALARAKALVGKGVASEFTVDGNRLTIVSRSDVGELRDSLKFQSKSNVSVRVVTERLLAATDQFNKVLFIADCCVMVKDDDSELYMVAAYGR